MQKKMVHGGVLGAVLVLVSQAAFAELNAADADGLQQRVKTVLADPGATDKAAAAGRERGLVCAFCHGEDGNSPKAVVPHVAGQNPDYLVEQFLAYAEGTRKDYIMEGMMRDFSADDVVNLTVHYATQKRKPFTSSGTGQAERGRILFEGICAGCHGEDGRGGEGYPWIAAQNDAYLVRALERYRDPRGKRIDPDMTAVTGSLSDQNINDLATYMATMP